MDGRGRVQDNIFIEPLWCTVKHHYLYLHVFENGTQLKTRFGQWFKHYNCERSHQAHDNLTMVEVYFDLPHPFAEAA
jgi:putative transposase